MSDHDTTSFFVPNPLNRYLINSRARLHKNPDGSIVLYVQHNKPANRLQVSNWLPAPPPGLGFRLVIWFSWLSRTDDRAGRRDGPRGDRDRA